jgi:hypothetical protein
MTKSNLVQAAQATGWQAEFGLLSRTAAITFALTTLVSHQLFGVTVLSGAAGGCADPMSRAEANTTTVVLGMSRSLPLNGPCRENSRLSGPAPCNFGTKPAGEAIAGPLSIRTAQTRMLLKANVKDDRIVRDAAESGSKFRELAIRIWLRANESTPWLE